MGRKVAHIYIWQKGIKKTKRIKYSSSKSVHIYYGKRANSPFPENSHFPRRRKIMNEKFVRFLRITYRIKAYKILYKLVLSKLVSYVDFYLLWTAQGEKWGKKAVFRAFHHLHFAGKIEMYIRLIVRVKLHIS